MMARGQLPPVPYFQPPVKCQNQKLLDIDLLCIALKPETSDFLAEMVQSVSKTVSWTLPVLPKLLVLGIQMSFQNLTQKLLRESLALGLHLKLHEILYNLLVKTKMF